TASPTKIYTLSLHDALPISIYSPDGQTDEEGNRIVRFEKDALVGTITTDNEGKGTLNNLPVGKYYLKETKTGESFVLDSEEKDLDRKSTRLNSSHVSISYAV